MRSNSRGWFRIAWLYTSWSNCSKTCFTLYVLSANFTNLTESVVMFSSPRFVCPICVLSLRGQGVTALASLKTSLQRQTKPVEKQNTEFLSKHKSEQMKLVNQKAIMQLTEACPKRPRKPKTLHLTPSEFISISPFLDFPICRTCKVDLCCRANSEAAS